MKRGRLNLALLLSCSALFACAPKVNLSEYGEKELDSKTAQHKLPDYVVNKKKPRVAVLPFGTAQDVAKRCNLDASAQENTINTLVKVGTTEVVERGQLNALMQEAKLSVGIGGDIDIAQLSRLGSGIDYVIVGSIASVNTSANFTEARQYTDRQGRLIVTPPTCTETGTASLTVRVLTFPAGTVLKAMTPKATKTNNREVRFSGDCRVQDVCGLLSSAVASAADDMREDFLALFPAYGYVYKTMTHNKEAKKRIAFITLGSGDGLKAGEKVDIIEFKVERDPVKGGDILREYVVSECTVVENNLATDRSICIIPEEKAQNVLVRHAVKTRVNVGLLRKIEKLTK
ncbi:MAG: CsgG/HfaB family protein [Aquificaceae bacterium]|nr:CsgG/HfaB family protein [Aquificaceae bacterium]